MIVIYVVAQSVMFPSVTDSPIKKINVIQATVVFDFPPPTPEIPIEIIKEEKLQPTEPEEELLVAETPADSQIEPITDPEEVQAIPIFPKPQVPQPKLEEEIPEEPEQNDDIMIMDKESTPTLSSEISAPATSMARRHLNSFQQQQQNKVAQQASRYYQQHKNSPVIDEEVEDPFITEGEKLMKTNEVRVDCSSITNKLVIGAAFITGGRNLKCSKAPEINGFIQDRINKKSHSLGQGARKNQKRPQSVVIKKQP